MVRMLGPVPFHQLDSSIGQLEWELHFQDVVAGLHIDRVGSRTEAIQGRFGAVKPQSLIALLPTGVFMATLQRGGSVTSQPAGRS